MSEVTLEERGTSAREPVLREGEPGEARRDEGQARHAAARRTSCARRPGMTDDAVLDKLVALGLRGNTIAALSLVPLIQVAWADGTIQDNERTAILQGAHGKGLEEGTRRLRAAADLARRSSPATSCSSRGRRTSRRSPSQLNDEQNRLLKNQIVGFAKMVAGVGRRHPRLRQGVGDRGEGAAPHRGRVRALTDASSTLARQDRRQGLAGRARHDVVRRRRRRGDRARDLARRARRRRQPHRHRRRLQRGSLRGDPRPPDARRARPDRARDQGVLPDGQGPQRARLVALSPRARGRGEPAPARDRSHRPLLPAPLRRRDRRSTRRCARSTIWCAPARSSTRRARTSRRGRSRTRSASRRCDGLRAAGRDPADVQPGQAPGRGRDPADGARRSASRSIPYSPTGGGLLTGKYGAASKPERGRLLDNKMYDGALRRSALLDDRRAVRRARRRARPRAGDARGRVGRVAPRGDQRADRRPQRRAARADASPPDRSSSTTRPARGSARCRPSRRPRPIATKRRRRTTTARARSPPSNRRRSGSRTGTAGRSATAPSPTRPMIT